MARIIATNMQPQVAATVGSAVNMTAVTNAANAVATLSAGHGVTVGDYLEIVSSGWPRFAGNVFRVTAVATNDVTLERADTSSTTLYPAGQGAGTARRISGWATLAQVNEINIEGGEQQYNEGMYLDSDLQFRYPTNKTPISISVRVDDDQSLSFWTHVYASANNLSNRGFRVLDSSGIPRLVCTGVYSVTAGPAMAVNQPLRRTISIAVAGRITEYTT